jgi:hypothetical protein
MNIALKEWSSVVDALAAGAQTFLLRKGGIVETRGFNPRYPEFLLFPTYEHQHARYLKPEYQSAAHALVPKEPEGTLLLSHLARVMDVFHAPASIEAMQPLWPHHIWNEEFLRQRYSYRPDLPLYAIVVRVYRLPEPRTIPLRPAYAGCKSWVHLTEEISVETLDPVLADAEFERRRADLCRCLARI